MTVQSLPDGDTPYGFVWGQVEVARLYERDGSKAVRVMTNPTRPGGHIDVYLSPTGRSLRAFCQGRELLPPDGLSTTQRPGVRTVWARQK